MTDHEKRIREALEAGPTEGPWIHNYDDVIASPDPEDVVAQCAWAETRPVATAAYIAACNPIAIRALLADLDAMRADAQRYRLLRRGQHWSVVDGVGDILRADELDARIDAALKGAAHE